MAADMAFEKKNAIQRRQSLTIQDQKTNNINNQANNNQPESNTLQIVTTVSLMGMMWMMNILV